MIELRCLSHMHAKVDVTPDPAMVALHATYQVKCGQCSRKRSAMVFHQWPLHKIAEAQAGGRTILWPCENQGDSLTSDDGYTVHHRKDSR